ncbi:MAG: hypothetical protein HY716_07650 [Planctomycetes bacterium]|nr:hypothetical protein [Planctomycetota bacterium]
MTKALAAAAALGFLGAASIVLSREPASPAATAAGDYPLGSGLKWVYRGPAGLEVIRHIGCARTIDGLTYLEMRYRLPVYGTRTLLMRRTEGGVVGRLEGVEQTILKFPMRTGDRWTIDFPAWNEVAECTVEGQEPIRFLNREAPATRLRVARRNRHSGRTSVDTEWYAPHVGLARMVVWGIPLELIRLERD